MKVPWEDDVATRLQKAAARVAKLTGAATPDKTCIAYVVDHDLLAAVFKADVTVIPKRTKFKSEKVIIADDLARGELTLGDPVKVDLWGFASAVDKHGITEDVRKSRWPSAKSFWLYPIKSIDQWQQPRAFDGASRVVDGVATVELLDQDVVELDQGQVDTIAAAKAIVANIAPVAKQFAERQIKYVTGSDRKTAGIEAMPGAIEKLASMMNGLEIDPAEYNERPIAGMIADLLEVCLKADLPAGALSDQIGRSAEILEAVIEVDDQPQQTQDWGDSILLRAGAVAKVGNSKIAICNGPFDDGTRMVALDRMKRAGMTKVYRNELGSAVGQVPLYDLCLVPSTSKTVRKSADMMSDLPPKRDQYPGAVQLHFKGDGMRVALCMSAHDRIIAWNVDLQKRVKLVGELKQARRLARRFSVDGTPYAKPWSAGAFATQNGIVTPGWLDIEAELFEPGEVGASTDAAGVIVKVADVSVQYGLQKGQLHEYFLTGDDRFCGRVVFKRIDGDLWYSTWTRSVLPAVLTSKAVLERSMPPDGYSAIPMSLEKATPKQWRYWECSGQEAMRKRDELVASGFFNDDNVRIVDGQVRRVFAKFYLDEQDSAVSVNDGRFKYGIAWQYWTSKSDAPSRQRWFFMVQDNDICHTWETRDDPMIEDQMDAVYRAIKASDLIGFDGQLDPGQQLCDGIANETKSIQSWVRSVDHGTAQLLEDGDSIRMRLHGKANAEIDLTREEDGSSFYTLEIGRSTTSKDRDGRGSSAMVFIERDGDMAYVDCPSCGALDLRLLGKSSVDAGVQHRIVACNACMTEFGVDGDPCDRNEITSKLDDQHAMEFRLRIDKAYRDSSAAAPYVILNAVPVRDGMQVWTDKSTDPDLDISRLRPPAIYEPMRAAKRFDGLEDVTNGFAVDAVLKSGIMIQPRLEGKQLSVQKKGERVVILNDEHVDLSKSEQLRWATKAFAGVKGDFVLDCEASADNDRLTVMEALCVPSAGNILAKRQIDRRAKLDAFMKAVDHDRIKAAPFVCANNEYELSRAVAFAGGVDGSTGALLKSMDARYTPGADSQAWAEVTCNAATGAVQKLMDQAIEREIPIYKADTERYVLGIVLEPNDGDGVPFDPDTQSDVYSHKDVRDAAHRFMEHFGNIGYMHSGFINDKVKILESYIAPTDFELTNAYGDKKAIRKGTWLLAVRVLDDQLWERVQIGEITGFSIGGNALRFRENQNAA